MIHELAGQPALAKLREVFLELDERERGLVDGGLLLGLVIDAGKPEYEQGDFLVRGLLGADPEAGVDRGRGRRSGPARWCACTRATRRSADRDLRDALRAAPDGASGGRRPAGALMFTCNGRGRRMFGVPDHDAEALVDRARAVPTAGFFAAGEIGPVGGAASCTGSRRRSPCSPRRGRPGETVPARSVSAA